MMRAVSVMQQPAVEPQVFVRAAGDGDSAAVEEFIAAAADVNAVVAYGKTALIAAAAGGHAATVRLLLRHGAHVNAQKFDGFSALISAVFFGHEEVVCALLEHGADLSAKDQTGSTAHTWALSRGLVPLAQSLKKAEVEMPAPAKAETKQAALAPVIARSATIYDEGEVVLDLDDEPVTRELKPLPQAARAPQPAARQPAAPPPSLPLVLPRVVESVAAPPAAPPPSEHTPANAAPIESEAPSELARPVRRAANFSPEFFRSALIRFKGEVTMRQLAIAFAIGIMAGGVLAYSITPQDSPTVATPSAVESAPATGVESLPPAQLPPAPAEVAEQESKVTEHELKDTTPATRGTATGQSPSSKLTAQRKSDGSDDEPSSPPKASRATTERRTAQRDTAPTPATQPKLKQIAPPPARIASEPIKETREAVATPRKITTPDAARTERAVAPPPAAPQPTSSPAKKVIRWP